jgi:hypothetical protein
MRRQPPPLRFLVVVVGGWICIRTAVHAPGWWVPPGAAAPRAVPGAAARMLPTQPAPGVGRAPPARLASLERHAAVPAGRRRAAMPRAQHSIRPGALETGAPRWPQLAHVAAAGLQQQAHTAEALPGPRSVRRPGAAAPGRWSGSAWFLARRDGGAALAERGSLGGSQAGVRILYRLNGDVARPLAVSARLNTPLRDRRAAEAAVGLDWRPLPALPVHLVAERREALGPRGRSAFALAAHGGVSAVPLPAGVRLDAYGQAGIVGTRSRDLFAEAAARATLPAGPFELGAAVTVAAQPGAARLDAGPILTLRLPEARLRVSAEWRHRLAGDARPSSGPAFTLATDF